MAAVSMLFVGLLTALTAAGAAPASAAWSAPGFVRSISGNGRPGVFPWGIQYNPVSHEIIVGDYLNYQLRRYSMDGEVLGTFFRPNSVGQPYSVAVDPRNGDIYTPEIADGQPSNKVARYTKDGTFVSVLTLTGIDYMAWITIDDQGNLWQSDSHYTNNGTTNPPAIRKWRLSDGRQTASWDVRPFGVPTPRMYGIDVDASGNVWATDTINKAVYKWNGDGRLLATYTDAAHLAGDLREITVDDAHGWYYVTDGAGDQIEKYALNGTWLQTIGGSGASGALGNLDAPRQTTIDSTGKLYIAEYGNARVSVAGTDGVISSYFPDPAQPAPAGQLGQPRDVDVDASTGDVWVADSWNQRVQKFSSTGAFLGTWGNRGANPPYGMNYPRGIAVDPVSRNIWVVNQRGHHIKRYRSDMTYLDTLGSSEVDSSAPGSFRWPLDVEFWNGMAFVSDRNSRVIKVLDATTGTEIRQWSRNNHALAVDPATGNVYVSDPSSNRIYVYTSTGSELGSFGSTGSGAGQFRHAWDAVVSGGLLYVTDDTLSRVSVFTLGGTFQGSFGGAGTGPFQFRNPSGIAADGTGKIYVTDAANDRIQVFDTTRTRAGANSWPPPTTTITSPGNGVRLVGAPVTIAGTVTDNTGVGSVEVAVQDTTSGLWFDASNSTWQAAKSWAIAPYTSTVPTSAAFSWVFIGEEYGHTYGIEARATDVGTNLGPSATSTFSVLPKNTTDTQDPDTVVSSPTEGQVVAVGAPLAVAGRASDDIDVAAVQVAITRGGGQWWQPAGGWGPFAWLDAGVDTRGATSTGWQYSWTPPGAGTYAVTAKAVDGSGREDAVRPLVGFTAAAPDTVAPDGAVTFPRPNGSLAGGPVTMTGTATDDVGVGAVKVSVKDAATNLWLQPDGSFGAFASVDAVLASPGAATTTWSYTWTAPAAGSYVLQLRTDDTSANTDPTKPRVPFTIRP